MEYRRRMSNRITPQIVAEHGLSTEEYERVLHAMGASRT
jgi:phosphoribosylformylglycinamidine synthase